jgi:glycosyltransferase involved in cell wall biosynthesis
MLRPMSALRVALDLTPAHVSGAGIGRYANGIGRALARRADVELRELTAPTGLPGRLGRGLLREGLWYPLLLGRRARGAEVVHCPAPYGPRTAGLPLVLSAHDVLPLSSPELFTRTMTAHMRHVGARHLRGADRVLCGSEHVREQLAELAGVDRARIAVTPYGVDERFRPGPSEPEQPYVLCVGTLEPRKNLAGALRAFERAAPPDVRLVIAGASGWRNTEFERELGARGGRVTLAGRVSEEELVRLYSGAACFLYPTLAEGFGFPVLEAMASGAPVVASDTTSLPELAGDAALLVDPADEEAVADALGRVLGDPALSARLRERGLERAAAFTWDACADATVAAYREAIG